MHMGCRSSDSYVLRADRLARGLGAGFFVGVFFGFFAGAASPISIHVGA